MKNIVVESWSVEHSGEGKTETRVSIKTEVGGVLKVDTYDMTLDKKTGEEGVSAIELAAKDKLSKAGLI